MPSLGQRIDEALKSANTNHKVALIVWEGFSIDEHKTYSFKWVFQVVKAFRRSRNPDPNQLVMLVDDELVPVNEVNDIRLLKESGYREIKEGQTKIINGQAKLARAERLLEEQRRK